jgi:hypothetical protein
MTAEDYIWRGIGRPDVHESDELAGIGRLIPALQVDSGTLFERLS